MTVPPARISTRAALWLALGFAAVLRWPLFLRPLQDLDEPNFASIAALCDAGGRLYAEGGVDNKPPGIFWSYQLAFALGGRFAMAAVHLLCATVVLATAWLLGRVARRLGSERAGLFCALLYGVFSLANDPRMMAANTENFMMLPLAGALWLVARNERPTLPRLAAAGALVAVACLFKQVALVTLGVVALALLAPLRAPSGRGRALARALAGGLVCLLGFAASYALVVVVLVAQHTLDDALHWTVTSLFSHYGPSAWSGSAAGRLGDALASVALFALTALPLCAAGLLGLRAAGERGVGEWLAIAWLPLSALGVAAGGHFSDHYFIQLLGPLALLGGLHIGRQPAPTPRWTGAIALFGVALMTSAALVDPISFQPFWRPARPDYRALAAAIDARTQPEDRIFVWGNAPAIYVLSNRLPATRFVGFLRGLRRSEGEAPERSWDAGPEVWPLLAADFARHPPALVVDTATGNYREFGAYPLARFPAVEALVTAGYVLETQVEGATLYRRRR